MPPKALIFTKEIECQLFDQVEKRPLLWDATSDIYRRADMKPLAWEEVAAALGTPFTAEIVAKRFKNMKENFAKNYAKVRAKKSKSSGDGYDDSFQPTWYLYNRLKFLERSCSQSSSESNLPVNTSSSQPVPSPNTEATLTECGRVDIYFDETLQSFQVIPYDETVSGVTSAVATENQDKMLSMDSSTTSDISLSNPASPMGPPRPLSSLSDATSSGKRSHEGDEFFNKRGANSKVQTSQVLEKAVSIMQEMANQPPPTINLESKPWDGICALIGHRLSTMTEEKRRQCENELLQVLLRY